MSKEKRNPSHTIVTFYTDENNDGKYTPGTDELLGSEMIKDGAKGADGRDGKSLLTVKDGKELKFTKKIQLTQDNH